MRKGANAKLLPGTLHSLEQHQAGAVLGWSAYSCALLLPNILLLSIDRDITSVEKLVIAAILLIGWHISFRKISYAIISMLPFFLILPFDLFFTHAYQEPPTLAVAGILAHTNINETMDYLDGRKLDLALALILALAVWACAFRCALSVQPSRTLTPFRWLGGALSGAWIFALACSVILASLSVYSQSKKVTDLGENLSAKLDKLTGTFPFGRIISIVSYMADEQRAASLNHALQNFRFESAQEPPNNSRQVYVLVIGEASRPDRWQLNSYGRETNPLLSKEANLVPLTDVLTPWTFTDSAVPIIVSRKPENERSRLFGEKSIVSLFKEAGFHTTWLSNQARQNASSPLGLPAFEADELRYLNVASNNIFGRTTYDELLLPALRKVLGRPERKQFVVLHLLGSHDSYQKRYPPLFNHWRPSASDPITSDDSEMALRQKFNNSYDNSILYTDYVLSNVIALLRKDDSLAGLFYVSDHGESLLDGQCPQSGHGQTGFYNYPVSAFVWLSQPYSNKYPDAVQNLRLHSNSKLTTANTFDSLVQLAHITYRNATTSKGIFSSAFRETPRLVNVGSNIVNWDRAQFVGECRKPTSHG